MHCYILVQKEAAMHLMDYFLERRVTDKQSAGIIS